MRVIFVQVIYARPGDICQGDICSGNICPGDKCSGDICPGDICPGDLCLGDICLGDICPCPGTDCYDVYLGIGECLVRVLTSCSWVPHAVQCSGAMCGSSSNHRTLIK